MAKKATIFSENALIGMGVLVSPFVFTYAALVNIRASDTRHKTKLIMISLIPSAVVLFLLLLPAAVSLPVFGINVGLVFWIVNSYLRSDINAHREKGGRFKNPFPTAIIGLCIVLLTLGIYIGVSYNIARKSLPISFKDFVILPYTNFDAQKYDDLVAQLRANEDAAILANDSLIAAQNNLAQLLPADGPPSGERPSPEVSTLVSQMREQSLISERMWLENISLSEQLTNVDNIPESLKQNATLYNSYSEYRYAEAKIASSMDEFGYLPEDQQEDYFRYRSRADQVLVEINKQFE